MFKHFEKNYISQEQIFIIYCIWVLIKDINYTLYAFNRIKMDIVKLTQPLARRETKSRKGKV